MSIIFFISGLIGGSFLHVVACRLSLAESFLTGRSYCPHCKNQIRWYDNIPVLSFILLGMKCRDCKEKISWQYPLVELLTGTMFALVGQTFFVLEDTQTWLTAIYYLGSLSFLLVIFIYDLNHLEIPGPVLWPAIGWAVAFNLFFDGSQIEPLKNIGESAVYSGGLAAFLAFLFFFLLVAVSKEKWMGMGDAQLVILLGLILGWPKIILALILAFSLGAVIGMGLIFCKRKKMDSQIPFAPFLIAGTFITIFFYAEIVDWYLRLLIF
jgi:prepilin signal peptidase PulO-like enzyme (type II secretory pathway)